MLFPPDIADEFAMIDVVVDNVVTNFLLSTNGIGSCAD
jgi:hypothetical protein